MFLCLFCYLYILNIFNVMILEIHFRPGFHRTEVKCQLFFFTATLIPRVFFSTPHRQRSRLRRSSARRRSRCSARWPASLWLCGAETQDDGRFWRRDQGWRTWMVLETSPTFFPDKGQRPGEDVHEVWQPVRMWGAVELPDVHHVVFILQDSSWWRHRGWTWILGWTSFSNWTPTAGNTWVSN